ncbi:virion structural protein [Erwinia phage PhiEaH1]|jgi:hypothetical protein|uniref:Uncharacterized protein n=1 Tax=Erwinia phage PhiEaH1 TaxID=1401669 RepID=W8D076_9CAUD|nr:virion structural protein [Erwinia phage PhiEaH1]AGX01864.1 hypothetical protein [Erwinia phage PhiEaH1]WBF04699.1 hypothetical protein [Erwinia phage vB_Ea277G]
MDITKLKRNPAVVVAALKELPDGSLAVLKPCRIHVPETFRSKQLLTMGRDTLSMGFFSVILDSGEYGVYTIPAMIRLNPAETVTTTIDEREYYEFRFQPGQILVKSTDLVKDNILLYYLVEEIVARGRIPWYYTYEDLGEFFNLMLKYAGSSLVLTPAVGEMVIAQIARMMADRRRPIREILKKVAEDVSDRVAWVPLRNVEFGAQDTTAKVTGSYMAEGLDSAIVNPSDKVSKMESILRT